MKFMKKVLLLLIASLSIVLLVGCNPDSKDQIKLSAEKTTIDVGEQVFLTTKLLADDKEESVLASLVEFTTSDPKVLTVSPAGMVVGVAKGTATVTATFKHGEKSLTASLKFKVVYKVPTPTGLAVVDNLLTWNAVEGADSYQVEINGVKKTVKTNSYDLSELAEGSYEFKVIAKVGSDSSDPATLSFVVVSAEQQAEFYAEILKAIDDSYLPDMKESDFENEYFYEDYLMYSKLAQAYTTGALQTKIDLAKSLEVIDFIKELSKLDPESPAEIKSALDPFFQMGLTSNQLARVLYEILIVGMDFEIQNILESIDYIAGQVDYYNQMYESELISPAYVFAIEYLNNNGFKDLVEMLEDYYVDKYSYKNMYYYQSMAEQLANAYYYGYLESFLFDLYNYNDDDLLIRFMESLLAALKSENMEYYNNCYNFINSIIFLKDYQNNILYYQQRINDANNNIELFKSIKEVGGESSAVMVEAFNSTISFIMTLYSNIDSELFESIATLVSGGEISPAEIFILKDELVAILKTSLPAAKDFENLYVALIAVLNNFFEINPSELAGLGQMLGLMTNTGANLLLDIVGDITIEIFGQIQALVEALDDPSSYVDLVLYVGNLVKGILEKYSASFELLTSSLPSALVEQIIIIYKEILPLTDADENTVAMMTMLLDSVVENYQLYQGIEALIEKYGTTIISKFLATNGKIAYDIINLFFAKDDATPYSDISLADQVKDIFAQFMEYHELLFGAITDEEIDLIVDFLAVYAPFILANVNPTLADGSLNSLIAIIAPELKATLKDLLKLEVLLVNTLYANNAAYEFINLGMEAEYNQMVALTIVLIKALDVVLTPENIAIINARIASIFTNVLLKPDFLAILNTNESEVLEMKAVVEATLEQFIPAIKNLAKYDYYNLTPEQLEEFYGFLEMFN